MVAISRSIRKRRFIYLMYTTHGLVFNVNSDLHFVFVYFGAKETERERERNKRRGVNLTFHHGMFYLLSQQLNVDSFGFRFKLKSWARVDVCNWIAWYTFLSLSFSLVEVFIIQTEKHFWHSQCAGRGDIRIEWKRRICLTQFSN